jgi:hypothetical protein
VILLVAGREALVMARVEVESGSLAGLLEVALSDPPPHPRE